MIIKAYGTRNLYCAFHVMRQSNLTRARLTPSQIYLLRSTLFSINICIEFTLEFMIYVILCYIVKVK